MYELEMTAAAGGGLDGMRQAGMRASQTGETNGSPMPGIEIQHYQFSTLSGKPALASSDLQSRSKV